MAKQTVIRWKLDVADMLAQLKELTAKVKNAQQVIALPISIKIDDSQLKKIGGTFRAEGVKTRAEIGKMSSAIVQALGGVAPAAANAGNALGSNLQKGAQQGAAALRNLSQQVAKFHEQELAAHTKFQTRLNRLPETQRNAVLQSISRAGDPTNTGTYNDADKTPEFNPLLQGFNPKAVNAFTSFAANAKGKSTPFIDPAKLAAIDSHFGRIAADAKLLQTAMSAAARSRLAAIGLNEKQAKLNALGVATGDRFADSAFVKDGAFQADAFRAQKEIINSKLAAHKSELAAIQTGVRNANVLNNMTADLRAHGQKQIKEVKPEQVQTDKEYRALKSALTEQIASVHGQVAANKAQAKWQGQIDREAQTALKASVRRADALNAMTQDLRDRGQKQIKVVKPEQVTTDKEAASLKSSLLKQIAAVEGQVAANKAQTKWQTQVDNEAKAADKQKLAGQAQAIRAQDRYQQDAVKRADALNAMTKDLRDRGQKQIKEVKPEQVKTDKEAAALKSALLQQVASVEGQVAANKAQARWQTQVDKEAQVAAKESVKRANALNAMTQDLRDRGQKQIPVIKPEQVKTDKEAATLKAALLKQIASVDGQVAANKAQAKAQSMAAQAAESNRKRIESNQAKIDAADKKGLRATERVAEANNEAAYSVDRFKQAMNAKIAKLIASGDPAKQAVATRVQAQLGQDFIRRPAAYDDKLDRVITPKQQSIEMDQIKRDLGDAKALKSQVALGAATRESNKAQAAAAGNANRFAAAVASGKQQAIGALGAHQNIGSTIGRNIVTMAKLVILYRLARELVMAVQQGFNALIQGGLEYTKNQELQLLGLRGILAENYEVLNAQGQQVTGSTKILELQIESVRQWKQLQSASLAVVGTTEDLMLIYNSILPYATRLLAKDTARRDILAETQKMTKATAIAASVLDISFQDARSAMVSMLQGRALTRNRLVGVLGIPREEIQSLKDTPALFDRIYKALDGFNDLGEEAQKSFGALTESLHEFVQIIGAQVMGPAVEQFKKTVAVIQDLLFVKSKTGFELKDEIKLLFMIIREDVKDALEPLSSFGKELKSQGENIPAWVRGLTNVIRSFIILTTWIVKAGLIVTNFIAHNQQLVKVLGYLVAGFAGLRVVQNFGRSLIQAGFGVSNLSDRIKLAVRGQQAFGEMTAATTATVTAASAANTALKLSLISLATGVGVGVLITVIGSIVAKWNEVREAANKAAEAQKNALHGSVGQAAREIDEQLVSKDQDVQYEGVKNTRRYVRENIPEQFKSLELGDSNAGITDRESAVAKVREYEKRKAELDAEKTRLELQKANTPTTDTAGLGVITAKIEAIRLEIAKIHTAENDVSKMLDENQDFLATFAARLKKQAADWTVLYKDILNPDKTRIAAEYHANVPEASEDQITRYVEGKVAELKARGATIQQRIDDMLSLARNMSEMNNKFQVAQQDVSDAREKGIAPSVNEPPDEATQKFNSLEAARTRIENERHETRMREIEVLVAQAREEGQANEDYRELVAAEDKKHSEGLIAIIDQEEADLDFWLNGDGKHGPVASVKTRKRMFAKGPAIPRAPLIGTPQQEAPEQGPPKGAAFTFGGTKPISGHNDIDSLIAKYSSEYGIPPELLFAIADVESGGSFKTNLTSPKGARGLMQLMPSVISDKGVTDPMDVEQSVKAAAQLLQHLIEVYAGDIIKAATAYHGGPGNVPKVGELSEKDFPNTVDYARKITAKLPQYKTAIATAAINGGALEATGGGGVSEGGEEDVQQATSEYEKRLADLESKRQKALEDQAQADAKHSAERINAARVLREKFDAGRAWLAAQEARILGRVEEKAEQPFLDFSRKLRVEVKEGLLNDADRAKLQEIINDASRLQDLAGQKAGLESTIKDSKAIYDDLIRQETIVHKRFEDDRIGVDLYVHSLQKLRNHQVLALQDQLKAQEQLEYFASTPEEFNRIIEQVDILKERIRELTDWTARAKVALSAFVEVAKDIDAITAPLDVFGDKWRHITDMIKSAVTQGQAFRKMMHDILALSAALKDLSSFKFQAPTAGGGGPGVSTAATFAGMGSTFMTAGLFGLGGNNSQPQGSNQPRISFATPPRQTGQMPGVSGLFGPDTLSGAGTAVGSMTKSTATATTGAAKAASAASKIASALPLIGMGAGIAIGIATAMFARAVEKAKTNIEKRFKDLKRGLAEEDATTGKTLQAMQAELEAVKKKYSKSKSGRKALKELLPGLEDEIDALKQRVKDIQKSFREGLADARAGQGPFADIRKQLMDFEKAAREYLETFTQGTDAYNQALKDVTELFNITLINAKQQLQSQFMDAESESIQAAENVISLMDEQKGLYEQLSALQDQRVKQLEKIRDIEKQIAEIGVRAAQEEADIRRRGVLEAQETVAAVKAREIIESRNKAAEEIDNLRNSLKDDAKETKDLAARETEIRRNLRLNSIRLAGARQIAAIEGELFHTSNDRYALESRRVAIEIEQAKIKVKQWTEIKKLIDAIIVSGGSVEFKPPPGFPVIRINVGNINIDNSTATTTTNNGGGSTPEPPRHPGPRPRDPDLPPRPGPGRDRGPAYDDFDRRGY